jgi:acyl-CoA synthetase (AMP-forming)/AMP-acid ligase II
MSRYVRFDPVSFTPSERAAEYRAQGLWDGSCLTEGIEAAARDDPDGLALVDNRRRLTHGQLAARVAGGVSLLGAQSPEGGVAILATGNSAEGVIAYQALLRHGATTWLLDRRCGSAEVEQAIEVLGASAVVIVPTAEAERLVGSASNPVVALEAFSQPGDDHPAVEWAEPDRNRPAVIVPTSGTTNRPKGVVHSLNTLTAGASNMAQITSTSTDSVIFLVSPLMSITGVMQMHLAADQHAALILEDHFDPDNSLDRLNSFGATLLGGAPVIAERLLQAAARRPDRTISLRTLALGGSMLPRPLLEMATDDFGIEIARVYGSSEAPNFSGSTPEDDRERRLSDDGALMPGGEVRIGSANHELEGLLQGPGVCLAYIDPQDNEAAFEDGWYRTGDLVELNGNRLTVVGRLKEIVNRNGLKISLGEIDSALAGLAGTAESAAFGRPDTQTGERLAVAIQPEQDASVTLDLVTEHLLARGLAKRKLPEEVVFWDEPLPRTASGKVVRSRLVMEAPGRPSERADRLR